MYTDSRIQTKNKTSMEGKVKGISKCWYKKKHTHAHTHKGKADKNNNIVIGSI